MVFVHQKQPQICLTSLELRNVGADLRIKPRIKPWGVSVCSRYGLGFQRDEKLSGWEGLKGEVSSRHPDGGLASRQILVASAEPVQGTAERVGGFRLGLP